MNSNIQIEYLTENISPIDVINWLITQSNLKGKLYSINVARAYVYCLNSVPLKLKLSLEPEDRNVFACHTVEKFTALWELFKSASNYELVNKVTSGQFSSGMACLLRYLEYLSKTTAIEHPENTLFSYVVSPALAKKLTQILSTRFSNGFRIDSPIELERFRRFATKANEKIDLTDNELIEAIIACGIYFEKKIYIVLPHAKDKINELVNDYFDIGLYAIFYSEFYTKNESWLFKANIISEKMLIVILRKLFPKLKFTNSYFGLTDASVFNVLENEILHVWGTNKLLTYEQLAEHLQYVPLEKIKYALGQNNDFIWNSNETFLHISRLDITEEEQKNIRRIAQKGCTAHGYISVTDLPLGEIQERYNELSITAIHNAVFRICLSDKFDKKGKIIFRKGETLDALSIMKEYCRTIDKCSLNDLLNYEKELTGEIHRWIPMEAGNNYLVRIDKDTYVADKYVHFNSDKIDNVISQFVKGDYLPVKAFVTYGVFPDCGQIWNLFLLESYCRRFSKKYRFDTPSVNSRNAGTIIRKCCNMEYTEIIVDAVAKSGIELTETEVGLFLFNEGYIGRSTNAVNKEIINRAKALRERRN